MNPFTLAREADKLMAFLIGRYGSLRVTRHYERITQAIAYRQQVNVLNFMREKGMMI
jgi:hypothetical protein